MSLFGKTAKVELTDITRRFNLIGRVGQGSMSKVWRAEDKMNGNFVAVKVLDKEKTKRFEERFKGLDKPSESDIASALNHPYIVKTIEVGWTLEEEVFLVMDYVEGSGLSLLVDLQSDDLKRYRIRFMIQIGEALSYFHKQDLIHRDICPRNIMITDDHKVRLIDFGLTVPNKPEFCRPGNRTGTANYMAPELIKRRPTDQRIDVFAYAVTCYEMYTNRHPWDAAQTLDAVMQHINQPPVPLTELVPEINPQVADTIMKGLENDPDDRCQTIDEMIQAFREAEVRMVKATKELLSSRKRQAPKTSKQNGAGTSKKKSAKQGGTETPKKPSGSTAATVVDDDDLFMDAIEEELGSPTEKPGNASRSKKTRSKPARHADDKSSAANQSDADVPAAPAGEPVDQHVEAEASEADCSDDDILSLPDDDDSDL